MSVCVCGVSLLIWHIVCFLWFTAQPGNVRQEQVTEGETKKTWYVTDRIVGLCVLYTNGMDDNTIVLIYITIYV